MFELKTLDTVTSGVAIVRLTDLRIQDRLKQFINKLWISLPLRYFHDLADKKTKSRCFPASVLLICLLVRGNHFADDVFDFSLIRNLF